MSRTTTMIAAASMVAAVLGISDAVAAELSTPGLPPASAVSSTTTDRPGLPWWMKRPCPTEDSVNCFWNARLHGTGTGHSFYVRRMPSDITGLTCRFFVARRYAANHDRCAPQGD